MIGRYFLSILSKSRRRKKPAVKCPGGENFSGKKFSVVKIPVVKIHFKTVVKIPVVKVPPQTEVKCPLVKIPFANNVFGQIPRSNFPWPNLRQPFLLVELFNESSNFFRSFNFIESIVR